MYDLDLIHASKLDFSICIQYGDARGCRAKHVRYFDISQLRYIEISQLRYFDISKLRYITTSVFRHIKTSIFRYIETFGTISNTIISTANITPHFQITPHACRCTKTQASIYVGEYRWVYVRKYR